MSLIGAEGLHRRLDAIQHVFEPIEQHWADQALQLMQAAIPVRTGRTRASLRRTAAVRNTISVVGGSGALMIDRGTRAHVIGPQTRQALKFAASGQPVFAKRVNHPATAARPFIARAATEAFERSRPGDELIALWNRAG